MAEVASKEPIVVITEHLAETGAAAPAPILNAEAVSLHITATHPDAAVHTAAVRLDRYDADLAVVVGGARALVVVVHPDVALNAGLAYAVLLRPGATLLLVESTEFGPGWPMGRGAFEHGILSDLQQGAGIRCASVQRAVPLGKGMS